MSSSLGTLVIRIAAFVMLFCIGAASLRMVRLCIASIDPSKLSSQCVMCNRREFPMTAIDCTGITKMNDLISNPLSIQEATCLIYNCRRQVPEIKPEPYHGSVSQASRASYPSASVTRNLEMMPPTGIYGTYPGSASSSARYSAYGANTFISPVGSRSVPDGSDVISSGRQGLPYAIVPTYYNSLFGARKYKTSLVPLFK